MLSDIQTKIRALVEDIGKSDFEVFEYTNSAIFTIAQENITITEVLKNGTDLGSGDYSFDSTTNKITIIASLILDDKIEIDYTYYNYSDSELKEWVRAALVWISIFSYCETDYELEDDIYPTPDNKSTDLISLIASILIRPNYSEYNLPNLKVKYPKNIDKEEKIRKIIQSFRQGLGTNGILEYN